MAEHDLSAARDAARRMTEVFRSGGKILAFGNGGSATDAQHFAAELVGRFMTERRPLPALALTSDSAVVTCLGNDYGYDTLFDRQIRALAVPGDLCLAITTSGASPNVLAGLRCARGAGLFSIAMTGRDGGAAGKLADLEVNVPEQSTARIQEVQRTLLHAFCEIIERSL